MIVPRGILLAPQAPDEDSRRSLILRWRPTDVHRTLGGLDFERFGCDPAIRLQCTTGAIRGGRRPHTLSVLFRPEYALERVRSGSIGLWRARGSSGARDSSGELERARASSRELERAREISRGFEWAREGSGELERARASSRGLERARESSRGLGRARERSGELGRAREISRESSRAHQRGPQMVIRGVLRII